MVLGTALSSCTRHFFFINCVHFIDYSPTLKSLLSLSIKTEKLKPSYVKNTASLNPPLPNELNNAVEIDNGEILTPKQVNELQKRNAQLEEENLILKKAHNFRFAKTPSSPVSSGIYAIFTPHSHND